TFRPISAGADLVGWRSHPLPWLGPTDNGLPAHSSPGPRTIPTVLRFPDGAERKCRQFDIPRLPIQGGETLLARVLGDCLLHRFQDPHQLRFCEPTSPDLVGSKRRDFAVRTQEK